MKESFSSKKCSSHRSPFPFKSFKMFYRGCYLGCKLLIQFLLLKIRAIYGQIIFFLALIIMKICLLRDLYFPGKTHLSYKKIKYKTNIPKID